MKRILVVSLFLLLIVFSALPLFAAPSVRCLPPGVSQADLASWPVVVRQTAVSEGENGATILVSITMYQSKSGPVVLASVGDVLIFFDPKPDDSSVPGLMNEQMFTPDRLLRSTPRGACKWRPTRSGQSA